jgi:EAL domain-containing protein (putative c-di-GMP-specific phosphodiesterase class I)
MCVHGRAATRVNGWHGLGDGTSGSDASRGRRTSVAGALQRGRMQSSRNGAFELDVVFQPIVRLGDGDVYGYEALGRPRMPDGRPVSVMELFALAEHDAAALLALDRALRRRALERIAERPRDPSLRWFLNVDTRCAEAAAFSPGFTRRVLRELGLEHLDVVIELGERDPRLDRARLARLYPSYARQGFTIALDDFGAGHATLTRLAQLRPAIVKLDAALVHGLASDPYRMALVRGFATFAAEVGIALIAEGLERAEDAACVAALGVTLGQGYLFGKPEPLDPPRRVSGLAEARVARALAVG